MFGVRGMDEMKTCEMLEVKPDHPHTNRDHDLHCVCSECGTKITATADFSQDGRLLKVRFPIRYCPNCSADIVKFVLYSED